MPDVRGLADAYGVRVELADLGDWGSTTLVAEYDPDGPVIRVNERTLRQAQGDTRDGDTCGNVTLSLSKGDPSRAVDRAIAHELYHHREAIGDVARLAGRGAREAAADAFADALTGAR